MRIRTLSTLLSDVLSHLPGAEYERAKCEGLAAQVQEQRAHIEDLARRLEYTTRQKDEAEEAHVDAYEIRLDKTEGERDAIKAQYETEKAAHGETQKALTAAIAERDAWQLSHGIVARDKAKAEKERDALRARVAELESGESGESGEPVAWRIDFTDDDFSFTKSGEQAAKRKAAGATVTPLYAAPQPPALGVEGDYYVVAHVGDRDIAPVGFASDDVRAYVGSRQEAKVSAEQRLHGWREYRLVPADAPVVDVARIREVIADLGASYPRLFASESAHLLRAAIGEKA